MLKHVIAAALALALLLAQAALAEPAELSGWYGQDIAEAAEDIGGLTYAAGEEFKDNYSGEGIALRGDGTVTLIDVEDDGTRYALCGVTVGMAHADAVALLAGYPVLWDLDEEAAFIIVPDPEEQVNSQTLVLFFDEAGKVGGMWYRSSEG